MSSLPMTPQRRIQADEPRTTPRKASQGSRGNQGPHLERLSEHLKKLQDDLQSCSASRHPSITGQGTQERTGSAGTPRTATPRGRSFIKVLSEQQHLQKELVAEKAAREAAEARALIAADEAAAAAQWAQAVTHENEKLHQLTGLQKAIVSSLQDGHRTADAAVRRADELARTSQHAQRDSLEASKLHNSLLQHTGHAKALEQSMETLKSTLKGLRHDLGAKNAELAITKAEAEAFRRQLIPGAGGTLHADTEMLSGGEAQKQRLKAMQERILQRTMPIEEVWVEVQHCEERVQLLCTITRAVETHVSILQDELCKAHAETAEVRGKLSEQEQLVTELRNTAADAAAAAETVPELEAQLATQQRISDEARAAAAASEETLAAALQDLKMSQEDLSRLRARESSTKAILSTIAAAERLPEMAPEHSKTSHGAPSNAAKASALSAQQAKTDAPRSPGAKFAGNAAAEQPAAKRSPTRVIKRARSIERLSGAGSRASVSPPRGPAPSSRSGEAAPGRRRHSAAATPVQSPQRAMRLQTQASEGMQGDVGSTDQHATTAWAAQTTEEPERKIEAAHVATGSAEAQAGCMELREPEEEILGQVGDAVPAQLPGAPGQDPSSRAAADQQRSRAIRAAITAVRRACPAALEHPGRPAPTGSPAQRQHQPQKASGTGAEVPSSSGMERGMSAALMSPGRAPEAMPSAQHGSPALTFATLIPQSSPLHARITTQQKEDGGQRESIIPRIWRSTVKRPLSADSDADIRSIPDLDRSSHASPSKALRPSASPVIGLTKAPDSDTSPTSSPGKGIRDSDSCCLIKAHTGGDVSSECRDSMCEGAAVTSTFISLGDVLRGTPLTGAQSIAAQPEQRDGARAAAAEASSSNAEAARSGARALKRDVRGLRLASQPADAASSASPSGSQRTWSGYMPVKLQDLAQIGDQPGAAESGSHSARSSQESIKKKWAPLTSRRSSPPADAKDTMGQRSPLTEVHLSSIGPPPPESLPEPTGKVTSAAAKRSLPDMEVCLSPALPLSEGLSSFGSTLPNKGLQKARRPKKPPTPRGVPAIRSSFSGDMNSAHIGRPTGVPMLDASLCNVVGSPMSPPDGQWADLHPGIQGSVNSRPQRKPAADVVQPGASPADEAIMRATQALSTRAERRINPQNLPALGRAGTSEAEVSPDVAAPSVRGPRHKVPLLNLSTESLRLSVEAMTPPCSFPLRGQKKAEREARWAAAAEARPTGRSESSEEDQATYDLTANAAMYNEGLHQLDASSCNILKESSTFINEPAPPLTQEQPAFREQPAAQGVDKTPRRDAAPQQQTETPPESARRKASFFQRLSPLLGKKDSTGSQEATPQKTLLEPSPSKGFGKLSPARWGWGKGSKKAAGRNLAAETCSPLRDGASAMTHGDASSQMPKGRRRLSPKKMTPWLGK